MRVVGYIRVSTAEQEESGLGIEAQEAKVRAYCDLYGLELVELFTDAASGKNLQREGIEAALGRLVDGAAEGLIVAKLDRLTRSVRDLGALLEDYFKDSSLVVVAEQVDTRTAAGRLVLNLLTSVAQWERETIGERTRDALRAKRRRGEKTGGTVPFGFDAREDGRLVENRQEQLVLNQIKALRAKGYGYKRIAAALNHDGHLTKTGRAWNHVLVGNVVRKAA